MSFREREMAIVKTGLIMALASTVLAAPLQAQDYGKFDGYTLRV